MVLDCSSYFYSKTTISTIGAWFSKRLGLCERLPWGYFGIINEKKSSRTRWDRKVPHKYCPTITEGFTGPYTIFAYTRTFIYSRQITQIISSTTVQHSDSPTWVALSPYFVVTRFKCNAFIYCTSCNQNTPQSPNSSITKNLTSLWSWTTYLYPPIVSVSDIENT